MKRTKIVDIFAPELIGNQVSVKGWVRTRRGNKNVQFVALNDGSTIKNIPNTLECRLQILSEDEYAELFEEEENTETLSDGGLEDYLKLIEKYGG